MIALFEKGIGGRGPKATVGGTYTGLERKPMIFETMDHKRIKMIPESASLTSLQTAENKVEAIGFVNPDGTPLKEQRLSDTVYRWNQTSGFAQVIDMDISNYNFHISSLYYLYPAVLQGINMPPDSQTAINTV